MGAYSFLIKSIFYILVGVAFYSFITISYRPISSRSRCVNLEFATILSRDVFGINLFEGLTLLIGILFLSFCCNYFIYIL